MRCKLHEDRPQIGTALLKQARRAELARDCKRAESLRKIWIELHRKNCPGCGQMMPWSHDVDECVQKTLTDTMDS